MEYFENDFEPRTSGGYGQGYNSWNTWAQKSPEEIRNTLNPLLKMLQAYDRARLVLEKEGGYAVDFARVTRILSSTVRINTPQGAHQVQLKEPEKVRQVLRSVNWDLKLQVRQLVHRMPVYYIGRIREDWWSEYSLIVEDIHCSPGYPVQDDRFYRMMRMGHEVYYLRVAQYRDMTAHFLALKHPDRLKQTDQVLYDAGRHVFQHAWHEDQRLAILIAQQFGLDQFKHAIELLYLCLSADLCELRSAVNPVMLDFLDTVYPQPAIRQLLQNLCTMEGEQLNQLPRSAIHIYKHLTKAFSRFLKTEIVWRSPDLSMPIWKLLYANLGRMEKIASRIQSETVLTKASQKLEKSAQEMVALLLEQQSRVALQ